MSFELTADAKEGIEYNRINWDERAEPHYSSPGYSVSSFLSSPSFLSLVIQFSRPHLPSLTDLSVIHLQCHIGTDTLSLARLGAKEVLGVDFSKNSIEKARELADGTQGSGGERLRFVEDEVYGCEKLDGVGEDNWDIVYTGIGALCWLPSISLWGHTVSSLLKSGGKLFIREMHPMLWTLSDTTPSDRNALKLTYPYFEVSKPTIFEDCGTYVESDHVFETIKTAEWNHGMGEIIMSLINNGMRIDFLQEHDSCPYNATGSMELVEGTGEWRVKEGRERLPCTYTLIATKM